MSGVAFQTVLISLFHLVHEKIEFFIKDNLLRIILLANHHALQEGEEANYDKTLHGMKI